MKKTPKRLRVIIKTTTVVQEEYIITPDKLEAFHNYAGDPGLLSLTVDKDGLYHYREKTLKHEAKVTSVIPTRLKKFN